VTQNTAISAERNGLGIAFVNGKEETPMLPKLSLLLLGISLFTGTASLKAQVKTDYDHTANFATYKTYSWLKVQAGDSLWDDRIKQDVDAQLAAKGWTRVDSNGDAAVSAFRSTQNQQTLDTFYNGFGGGWGWRGFGGGGFGGDGFSTTTTQTTKVGNVVVDVFDSHTKKLIWRGTDSQDLSSNANSNIKKLSNDINNMFKHFPPK
jgi:Domain of unknown function (DUF4136)